MKIPRIRRSWVGRGLLRPIRQSQPFHPCSLYQTEIHNIPNHSGHQTRRIIAAKTRISLVCHLSNPIRPLPVNIPQSPPLKSEHTTLRAALASGVSACESPIDPSSKFESLATIQKYHQRCSLNSVAARETHACASGSLAYGSYSCSSLPS